MYDIVVYPMIQHIISTQATAQHKSLFILTNFRKPHHSDLKVVVG